jgi:hypothetical protein
MPFGRGFGFRGGSPPWPYVGRGRGGFPRCWAFAPTNWDTPYADPAPLGAYPYPSPSPEYWGPYGMNDPFYSQRAPGYPHPGGWESPFESPMMTAEEEREWLKNQAESISQEIDRIKSRISELEKE